VLSGPHPFTLRQLQYIVSVADELSFGRAAARCRVSQPSLSSQVAQVEEALQVKVDVMIPDLPRQVNSATLLGEPAAASGAFRAGLLQLAHDVGLFRLPDGTVEEPKAKSGLFGWLRS